MHIVLLICLIAFIIFCSFVFSIIFAILKKQNDVLKLLIVRYKEERKSLIEIQEVLETHGMTTMKSDSDSCGKTSIG